MLALLTAWFRQLREEEGEPMLPAKKVRHLLCYLNDGCHDLRGADQLFAGQGYRDLAAD